MYTIVVADDEEELRRAIIRKIDWESTGFRVVGEAENGIEALELVERMEPDLLLTDIRMPFVSEIELNDWNADCICHISETNVKNVN